MSTGSGWKALDKKELDLLKQLPPCLESEKETDDSHAEVPEVKAETPAPEQATEAPQAAEAREQGDSPARPEKAPKAPGAGKGDDPPGAWARLVRRIEALVGLSGKPGGAPEPTYDDRYPRAPEWRREVPFRELAGLALSGGGIRSATFNLGLLQRLHREGILSCFDYLSTVSGGGYIGGFWSAWRSTGRDRRSSVFPGDGPTHDRPEPGEIRHLREFSNFLRPRLKLLSFETGRIVATLAGGVLPCIVMGLAVVVFALLAWWGIHWALTAEVAGRPPLVDAIVRACLLLVLTLGVQTAFELVWRRNTEQPEARATGSYVGWAALAAVLAAVGWGLLWTTVLPPSVTLAPLAPEDVRTGAAAVLPPAVAWTMAVLVLVALRSLLSQQARSSIEGRYRQGALDRALARTFFCAVAWITLGAVWLVGQLLAFGGVEAVLAAAGVGGASGGAFASLRRFLTAQTNKPTGGKLTARAGPWLFQALAYLTLVAVATTMAALLVVLHDGFGPPGPWVGFWVAFLVALASWCFNPHEVGLHGFYRDRLVRAYLGASNLGAPARATAVCHQDDVPLTCLPDKPLHLVCCAANDLFGDPLGTLHRGAESAVLSKLGFQVGDRWKPWASLSKASQEGSQEGSQKDSQECFQLLSPTLGDAMTASAAAFNSHMGQVSMRLGQAATFLLTALGLRLGLWIENPAEDRPGGKRPGGHLFLRELLGWSRANAHWIHLSDGAHYENLALYELVRRHCRFILLSDCGADPDRAFDDFGNVVRRVREDFGVEIKIDVSPLRPGEDGRSKQPMVAGDIVYPPSTPGGTPDHGILLYVKPTLTGNEPPDIAQYARRNERFPHETTLDQFYDEAQWESYRRLGEYAAERALTAITHAGRSAEIRSNLALFFLSARYHWMPLPEEEPLLRELDAEWVRLEKWLRKKKLEPLRRQLLRPEPAPGLERAPSADADLSLERALPLVREAVRIMEAVYLRAGFGHDDRSPSHRRYMGWLNRFGTWASAPDFQRCWPWLEPFLTRDFVVFMHRVFEGLQANTFAALGKGPTSEVRRVSRTTSGGYAQLRSAIPEASGAGMKENAAMKSPQPVAWQFGFFLRPPVGPELNAALVQVWIDPARRGAITWEHREFDVAPGLWGLGIGEAFLDRLVDKLESDRWLQLRVDLGKVPSAANDALYSGAGFRRDPSSECFVLDLPRRPAPSTRSGAEPT